MSSTPTRALAIIALGVIAGGMHALVATPFSLRYQPGATVPEHTGPAQSGDKDAPPTAADPPTKPSPGPSPGDGKTAAGPGPDRRPPTAELGLHITLAQAKDLFDKGTIFVDARTDHEYAEGHITGAMHLDPAALARGGIPDKVRNILLPKGTRIVIYCGGGTCDASENLAARLGDIGVEPMHIFRDGYPAWTAAGYSHDTEPDQFEDFK